MNIRHYFGWSICRFLRASGLRKDPCVCIAVATGRPIQVRMGGDAVDPILAIRDSRLELKYQALAKLGLTARDVLFVLLDHGIVHEIAHRKSWGGLAAKFVDVHGKPISPQWRFLGKI